MLQRTDGVSQTSQELVPLAPAALLSGELSFDEMYELEVEYPELFRSCIEMLDKIFKKRTIVTLSPDQRIDIRARLISALRSERGNILANKLFDAVDNCQEFEN